MKKTIGIFLTFFTCFLLIGINYAGSDSDGTLAMKSFSVNVPRGWVVERTGDDRVEFRMAESRSGDASIIVAAEPASGREGSEAWRKVKSVANFKNGIMYEGEDRFSDETWRKIVYGDEIRGLRFRCTALFARKGATQCVIRFSCPESRFNAMLPYFNALKESFAFAPDVRT